MTTDEELETLRRTAKLTEALQTLVDPDRNGVYAGLLQAIYLTGNERLCDASRSVDAAMTLLHDALGEALRLIRAETDRQTQEAIARGIAGEATAN